MNQMEIFKNPEFGQFAVFEAKRQSPVLRFGYYSRTRIQRSALKHYAALYFRGWRFTHSSDNVKAEPSNPLLFRKAICTA